ncbi:zinc finger mym-type protein 2-like: PROVISIONAL [Gigaspora margarita]|uniref:Zinc finger mym-type protein 2-like: PROVISIONAL n=1 Tax=Gigaspora margarita TaxID=4874 RepID=A0A8H4AQT7_GIGMA|nr:zinc finger mym-type protein 2-like: PROVISIONAL [Gigaspora margarita]
MRTLQNKELGNTKKSDRLLSTEIKQILDHSYMNVDTSKSLLCRVFFWLCLLCELQSSDTYRICKNDLEHCHDGGLELVLHKEKNNQGGVFFRYKHRKTSSQRIPILPDLSNNEYIPVTDILFYLTKVSDSVLALFRTQATKISTTYAIEVSTAQESESFTTEIPTAQANEVSTAIQVPSQIQNTNKARTSKPSKLKFHIQAHPYSFVMAPFKPPYLLIHYCWLLIENGENLCLQLIILLFNFLLAHFHKVMI